MGLQLSASLDASFPDDWDEAMGLVLGAVCEHVLKSGMPGRGVLRWRFVEAFNGGGEEGRGWVLHYDDPEQAHA